MDRANRIKIFKSMMYCLDDPKIPEKLEEWGFFDAPASTKYHGNYKGGLFDHSFAVTEALVDLTEKNGLIWQCNRSPWIIGMFHDLCKIDQYRHPVTGRILMAISAVPSTMNRHGSTTPIRFSKVMGTNQLCVVHPCFN